VEAGSQSTQDIPNVNKLSDLSDDNYYELVRLINSGVSRGDANTRVGLPRKKTNPPYKEMLVDYHLEFCSNCKTSMTFGIINKKAMPNEESHWKPFRKCSDCAYEEYKRKLKK